MPIFRTPFWALFFTFFPLFDQFFVLPGYSLGALWRPLILGCQKSGQKPVLRPTIGIDFSLMMVKIDPLRGSQTPWRVIFDTLFDPFLVLPGYSLGAFWRPLILGVPKRGRF